MVRLWRDTTDTKRLIQQERGRMRKGEKNHIFWQLGLALSVIRRRGSGREREGSGRIKPLPGRQKPLCRKKKEREEIAAEWKQAQTSPTFFAVVGLCCQGDAVNTVKMHLHNKPHLISLRSAHSLTAGTWPFTLPFCSVLSVVMRGEGTLKCSGGCGSVCFLNRAYKFNNGFDIHSTG